MREAAWHDAHAARLDGEVARLRESIPGRAVERRAIGGSRFGRGRGRPGGRDRVGDSRRGAPRPPRPAGRPPRDPRCDPARCRARPSQGGSGRGDRRGARGPRRPRSRRARRARDRADDRACGPPGRDRYGHRPRARRRGALAALDAADAADRARLAEAERAASTARERLRTADDRARAADHDELEARLGLESLRDGVLVELAGMGELGLASLGIDRAATIGRCRRGSWRCGRGRGRSRR